MILTGMGADGVEGLRDVRQAGGRIIVQDENSSVVFGMPGAALADGLADVVLPLEAIAPRLCALVGTDGVARNVECRTRNNECRSEPPRECLSFDVRSRRAGIRYSRFY